MEKKILIISDDSELLGVLQTNLPGKGYQVMSMADSKKELKEMLNQVVPDLIILDILMPWMDGIELCLRIRQWCQAPIIMLSTWGARKDMVRGLDLSAEGYLTKPFGVSELMTRIEKTSCQN